ncbi:MAG: hypothetical protein F4108_00080 [Acidimicrobiaceae bacterium]|nr:hypothetical protein [Acidimicrobiaceae bacterium]
MPDPLLALVDGYLRVAMHSGQDHRRATDVEVHLDDVAPVDEHAGKSTRRGSVLRLQERFAAYERGLLEVDKVAEAQLVGRDKGLLLLRGGMG